MPCAMSQHGDVTRVLAVVAMSAPPLATDAAGTVYWQISPFRRSCPLSHLDFDDDVPNDHRHLCAPRARDPVSDADAPIRITLWAHLCCAGRIRLADHFVYILAQCLPEDIGLIQRPTKVTKALNAKHPCRAFHAFQRSERRLNPSKDCCMAWDQKHDKLAKFNSRTEDERVLTCVSAGPAIRQPRTHVGLSSISRLRFSSASEVISDRIYTHTQPRI